MLRKILHYGFLLALICGLSILGVGIMYSITLDTIQKKKDAKIQEAVQQVLAGLEISNQKIEFSYRQNPDEPEQKYNIYIGCDPISKEPSGWAVEVGEQGYSSVVKSMVGVDKQDRIKAIEIVYQQETPGLGTECMSTGPKKLSTLWSNEPAPNKRPDFQVQFEGHNLQQLQLKKKSMVQDKSKEIEALSGATVTSAAVNRSVIKAIKIIQAFRDKKS